MQQHSLVFIAIQQTVTFPFVQWHVYVNRPERLTQCMETQRRLEVMSLYRSHDEVNWCSVYGVNANDSKSQKSSSFSCDN